MPTPFAPPLSYRTMPVQSYKLSCERLPRRSRCAYARIVLRAADTEPATRSLTWNGLTKRSTRDLFI
jgi:hypothetical protein